MDSPDMFWEFRVSHFLFFLCFDYLYIFFLIYLHIFPIYCLECFKMPNEQSEAVHQRRTDHTMTKRKKDNQKNRNCLEDMDSPDMFWEFRVSHFLFFLCFDYLCCLSVVLCLWNPLCCIIINGDCPIFSILCNAL
jgi:hypothetical protein